MTALATSLSVVALAIAAFHAYWGLGGVWPEKDVAALARAVVGDGRTRMPPPWSCFAVAAALVVVAAWPWVIVAWPDSRLVLIGSVVIGAVFFIRGSAGYSPRWRGRFRAEPFRTRDFYLYSPLCLALGVAFIALLTREMS
jgi:hypothetical protein